jgi:hypothetical protein
VQAALRAAVRARCGCGRRRRSAPAPECGFVEYLRKVALSAKLVGGGSWRKSLTLREPSADADRIRIALAPRLAELPAPVLALRLELVELTEPAGHQLELLAAGAEDRSRLSEGLRQVCASTGSGSVCTVVEVAPWSRIPETRALFVPRDD